MVVASSHFIGPDHGAESIEGKKAAPSIYILNQSVVLIKGLSEVNYNSCCLLFLSGPVLVTVEGGARAPHHETGAVRAHAPGRGGGGIAADPALAAEDTVTATSRAPNTSKYTTELTQFTPSPHRMQLPRNSSGTFVTGRFVFHDCSFFRQAVMCLCRQLKGDRLWQDMITGKTCMRIWVWEVNKSPPHLTNCCTFTTSHLMMTRLIFFLYFGTSLEVICKCIIF